MANKIKNFLNDPQRLEALYQEDKEGFSESFEEETRDINQTPLIMFWKIRLEYGNKSHTDAVKNLNVKPLLISCLVVIFLMNLAGIFNFSSVAGQMYNARNPILIAFLGLLLYELMQKRKHSLNGWLSYALIYVVTALQLNTLPDQENSQLLNLALIHTPVFLWFIYGLARCDNEKTSRDYWVRYLNYNGDLVLFSGLIMICWMIIYSISFGLFESLNLDFWAVKLDILLLTTVVVTPILAVFATERTGDAAEKVVPLIARIFNPIALVVLVLYLGILIQAGERLFSERSFLLLINIILYSVLALIVFSVSNMAERGSGRLRLLILYLVTLFSCSLNMLALSAIVYRLITYGITPNKLAVAGANVLVFFNLVKIGIDLLKVHAGKSRLNKLVRGIASYLPVYGIWAVVVIVIFPIIFL